MADFLELRQRLRDAEVARERAAAAAAVARERVRRAIAREQAQVRASSPDRPGDAAARERLRAERARAERERKERDAARVQAERRAAEALEEFVRQTDPREGIGRFDDRVPILLLPVRLETRFRTIPAAGGPPRRQLWVRIYPDDVSIDGFDGRLSETEVANARAYWIELWKGGGIEDQERAAWRGLVAGHGSGRAEWIVSEYRPLNVPEKPAKQRPEDVILTIPTEDPPDPAEAAAVAAYWRAAWLAEGDRAEEEAARAALEAAVGPARAAALLELHRPVNFATAPAPPLTRADVEVAAAFVVFPRSEDVETRRHSWSGAPRAALLPERFVFLGFAQGRPPVVVAGRPIPSPLVVGPDPSAPPDQQLQQKDGDLLVPEPMKWMVDFDRAVAVGMGLRVDLDELQAARGFDRVLVVGLRLGADEETSRKDLETLLEHHRLGRTGFSLVPQGTPTNNTEGRPAGFERGDDPDASFADLKAGALFESTQVEGDKKDGQWLAELLGLDSALVQQVRHAGGSDQADARAMNVALWPATLGYWMETMMAPVFPPAAVDRTRDFFVRFVSGRGAVPAVRIGRQPYGILPATAFSRMRWMRGLRDGPFLGRLHSVLRGLDAEWAALAGRVSFAGQSGDAHQTLLDVVGLHPASAEFSQRWAESLEQLFNRLNLEGLGGFAAALTIAALQQAGTNLLASLGHTGAPPDLLKKFFFGKHNALKGPVIQEGPLSETAALSAAAADGQRNYLRWLIDAANTSLDALYSQQGFAADRPPGALLYLMLRHALQLGYHDTSVRLFELSGLLTAQQAARARQDAPFVHVAAQAPASESRYALLTRTEPQVTGSPTLTVGRFIGSSLGTLGPARHLREQVQALERLEGASTARLERAFVEHLDCCSYRLDAWLLGLVHCQLAHMRNLLEPGDQPPRRGVHLGAYAWLEDVRPEARTLAPVTLPADLAAVFQRNGDPPLVRDSANQGFLHAASPNQAVAAAVLRSGYLANATPANRQTMAVNLTSERVRTALALLEGIRGGQSLGALLGYQFERGLHDRHALAEVDRFIYDLRREFPLAAKHLQSTQPGPEVPIESLEARNVIDGLALVSHVRTAGPRAYPFGRTLPAANAAEAAAIDAEVDRMLETHDAVADLGLAEGVYQAVLGNYDRVASTYDAYSKGSFPPEPQVVRTPTSGLALTHRVALHLEAGASPTASPVTGVAMTPRAQAEPALNRWLAGVLPPPGEVGCVVSFRDAATGSPVEREVTLLDLRLQPADLLHVLHAADQQAMSELDDRVVQFTTVTHAPRPDTPVSIGYRRKLAAPFSVFEVLPLVRALRGATLGCRALRATDLALTNEATAGADAGGFVDRQRIALVRAALETLRGELAAFSAALEEPLGDLENRRDELLAGADAIVEDLARLLARAAAFAIPETGWGLAYALRRRVFAAILAKTAALVGRWDERLTAFGALIVEYGNLPGTAPDRQKFDLLHRAEGLIATARTDPLPALPDDYRTIVVGRRDDFAARRDQLAAIADTQRTTVSGLLQDVQALDTAAFDFVEFSLADEEEELVRFAADAVRLLGVVGRAMDGRLAASQDLLDRHDAAAEPAARVKALAAAAQALLGEDFRICPEFALAPAAGDELENALGASQSGSLFEHLVDTAKVEQPVDTWFYGVARVRERLRAWEQAILFTGALGNAEPAWTPLQLPFRPDDRWLALQFPPEAAPDSERLLYTAHFASPFQKTAPQCGLLIDEWPEVIPSADQTTGIAFHYDRPNSEAPQTLLLVTPSEFRGAWQWADLVDALLETLDLAKRRAVEPVHLDGLPLARFLPATVLAVTMGQLTISANLALNNEALRVLVPE
jgi:hypothetical protein